MAQDPYPIGQIRVGHAEREAVAETLQQAAAEGRLDLEELDQRLDAALRARTYGDLDPLVADLSVTLPSQAAAGAATPPPAAGTAYLPAPGALSGMRRTAGPPPPGWSREDPLRLDAGVSNESRTGIWTVPPFLRIGQGVGSVKLNCLQARAAAPLIEVEVVPGAGTVLLILPDGWAVDADRIGKSWGSVAVKVSREPAPGCPLLVLYGSVGMGSLKCRPPRRRELRRAGLPDRPQLGS